MAAVRGSFKLPRALRSLYSQGALTVLFRSLRAPATITRQPVCFPPLSPHTLSLLYSPVLCWSVCKRHWLSAHVSRGAHTVLLLASRRFSSDHRHYRRADPLPDDKDDPEPPRGWSWMQLIPGVLIGILYYMASDSDPIPTVSFSFFLQHMLLTGEVDQLQVNYSREKVYIYLHPGAIINGQYVQSYGPQFIMTIPGVDSFEKKLNTAQDELGIPGFNRIPVKYRNQPVGLTLGSLIALAAFGFFWFVIRPQIRVQVSSGGAGGGLNPFGFMTKARTTVVTHPSQGSRFSEVAGMEEAKSEVMEFVDYLKNPQRYLELGARIPKGALLHGPPGTGKTLLARAIAGEAGVPFISIAGPDFVEMFAGVGSARVRDLFRQAKELSPCILYIDEVDAVGRSRQSSSAVEGTSESETTLNQLLVEMDGIQTLEGVVVFASTNRVDILDQALLRPGRFDRQIAIDLPTLPERKAIFDIYLKKVLLEKTMDRYSYRLAALTPGKSGADIANIVNEAALHAARVMGTAITEKDFEYAIERVVAGMEKKSGILDQNERKVVAYHEAGHALVGWLLEHTDPVLKVSIVPRTKGALGFAQHLPSDQKLYTKEQLFDRMCMMLGGRAAESVKFKRVTTGARDDLEKVTDLAYRQVAELGMNSKVGNVSFPHITPREPAKRFYSDKLAHLIDEEVRLLVAQAFGKAESLIKDHSAQLDKFAAQLLEREVLNYADMAAILGPMPYKKKHHNLSNLEEQW